MRQYGESRGPCIYHDRSSKGDGRRHDCYRAEAYTRDGTRIRRRFRDYRAACAWLGSPHK